MESVWLLLGGWFSIQSADLILVFLERRRFVAKPPIMRVGFAWISLDSLGDYNLDKSGAKGSVVNA
jgi:hypothetical protein